MNSQILPRFLPNSLKKKWKFGVKIAYGNLGYYSLVTWMLRIYPVFLEFTDQMGNRGKDGVWELNVLGTCRWIRRINPVSLEFIEQKWRIGLKIGYGNLGSIQFGGWILRFYPVFLEFVEKKWKIGVWVLRPLSTCSMNAQSLPRFSKIHRSNGKSG